MKKIDYSSYQIQIALYAKALSHPARVAILEFLFWEPARSAAYCQGYGVSTFDGAERIGAHTGRNPTTAGKVLYK